MMNNYEMALNHLAMATPFSSTAVRERAIAALKADGLSIMEAIKAVREVAKVSLGEAKEWVSSNSAWHPMHEQAKPLHEAAVNMIDTLNHRVEQAKA